MSVRVLLCGAALALAAGACSERPRTGEGGGPRPAPTFRIALAGGGVFDLVQQRGRVVLLFFGYTHCPDVCPTTLADFAHVRRELGPRAERVRFVFVTVDPARDTPADVMRYARAFDSTFVGLSTDSASLAPIMRGFGVGAYREPGGDAHTYTVAHTASVFVIDPEGRLREPVRFGPQRADALLRAVEEALE
jgi:protein SCO1/2